MSRGRRPNLDSKWPHGCYQRYSTGCRCEPCTTAASSSVARAAAQKLETFGFVFHGSKTTYNRGCRCEACTEGARKYNAEALRKKKSAAS